MTYDEGWIEDNLPLSEQAARAVVRPLLSKVPVSTVADLGCGAGGWAREFERQGCIVTGFDGRWASAVYRGRDFRAIDLLEEMPEGQFDLVVCLEVAEHLPEERAGDLVAAIAGMTDNVLWSAAVPGQNGTGHVNCQWPGYWAKLFAPHGLRFVDDLRGPLFSNRAVAWWYRQNLLRLTRSDGPMVFPDRVRIEAGRNDVGQ